MKYAIVFGAIGLLCMILSVVCNEKQKVLKLLEIKAVFYGIQYYLLGAMSGCISMFLGILRADLIGRKEKNPKIAKPIFLFLVSLYVISSILSFESSVDYLTILGNTCYFITLWFFKDIGIKIGTLITSIVWATYNALVAAYAAFIGNIIVIIILIIFIIKYYKKNKIYFSKFLK